MRGSGETCWSEEGSGGASGSCEVAVELWHGSGMEVVVNVQGWLMLGLPRSDQ